MTQEVYFLGIGLEEKLTTCLQAVCSASQAKPVETFLLIARTQAAIETDKKYLFISTWSILNKTSVSKGDMKSHIPEVASAIVSSSVSNLKSGGALGHSSAKTKRKPALPPKSCPATRLVLCPPLSPDPPNTRTAHDAAAE